jgi:hypothetical protein
MTTVKGKCDGKIVRLDHEVLVDGEVEVLVEFPYTKGPGDVGLPSRGIDTQQAADLRSRLATFAEDWSRPEMEAYDAL